VVRVEAVVLVGLLDVAPLPVRTQFLGNVCTRGGRVGADTSFKRFGATVYLEECSSSALAVDGQTEESIGPDGVWSFLSINNDGGAVA